MIESSQAENAVPESIPVPNAVTAIPLPISEPTRPKQRRHPDRHRVRARHRPAREAADDEADDQGLDDRARSRRKPSPLRRRFRGGLQLAA